MLKEMKCLEYTLEVLRVLTDNPGEHDSRKISDLIKAGGRVDPSQSYLQKVLPRMSRANLVRSSVAGYIINRPVEEVTIDMLLDMCEMPQQTDPLFGLCHKLKTAVSMTSVTEIYQF